MSSEQFFIGGMIGQMLNVNPIVSMDESGNSFVFGRAYSQRSNMEKVMTHISAMSKGREVWNYVVLHANNMEAAAWYARKMGDLSSKEPVSVVNISPVIGAHAGVGAASVALMFT